VLATTFSGRAFIVSQDAKVWRKSWKWKFLDAGPLRGALERAADAAAKHHSSPRISPLRIPVFNAMTTTE
jgi:hypothetical protein